MGEQERIVKALLRVRDGHATSSEKYALFDELSETYGHNSLAESLEAFGLKGEISHHDG